MNGTKIWRCTKCHHEWQALNQRECDWCGAPGLESGDAYGADLSPELVAIAIEAFNREGGKRAASQFLWTIAEPQMKAALTAALPLIAREEFDRILERACQRDDDEHRIVRRFLFKCQTERNIPLSQEGK